MLRISFIPIPLALLLASSTAAGPAEDKPAYFEPDLHPNQKMAPFYATVEAGKGHFPEEKQAVELEARLREWGGRLIASPSRGGREGTDLLLASDFRGARLNVAAGSRAVGQAFGVWKSPAPAADAVLDRAAFATELSSLVGEFEKVRVAEFLVTGIEVSKKEPLSAETEVRYDIVGSSAKIWNGERVGRWKLSWRQDPDKVWRITRWTALEQARSEAGAPVFTDATVSAIGATEAYRKQLRTGADDWLFRVDSVFTRDSMGHHGVSVADIDGDGLDDMFVLQAAGFPKKLFRNKGDGTFEDVTDAAGLAILDDLSQAVFADLDNDGDQDLIVVSGEGPWLFRNDGNMHFTYVPNAFTYKGGLKGTPMSIAVGDYDRDGFLDVYICTYSYFMGAGEDKTGVPTPYHDSQNGPPDVLLHNDGHLHFVDVTEEAGLNAGGTNNRFGFAAAWADYDEDGWPDIVVTNDFGRKNLFHNEGLKDGHVTFKDVASAVGADDYAAGMSATFFDYDNDGHLDAYFGQMWSAPGLRAMKSPDTMPKLTPELRKIYVHHANGNTLLRNRGDGTFEDVTEKTGTNMGRWAWSSDVIDFDSDGWDDLCVVNGMFTKRFDTPEEDLDSFFWREVVGSSPSTNVAGTPYDDSWRAINRMLADHSQASHMRNVFLRNDGHGSFDDVSGSVGLDLDQDGRSFAVFDYDMDGDPDLATMAARSAPQFHLFRNDFPTDNKAVGIRLTGTRSNRDAIGARVVVETDAVRRTRVLMANSGFISQHSKELLFGLGASTKIAKVTIDWPSGLVQTVGDVPIGERVWITEGTGITRHEAFRPKSVAPAGPPPAILEAPVLPTSTWLYDAFPPPDFKLTDLDGHVHSLATLRGKPAVLLFWRTSVPAAREALSALSQERAALDAAGVGALAISLDPASAAPAVQAAAKAAPGVPIARNEAAASDPTQNVGNQYAILNHFLFGAKEELHLPTAFLLNGQGEIVKAYRDKIAVSEIVADVPKIPAGQAERLARALPFPGKLYSQSLGRSYMQYALELVEQGYENAALPVFEHAVQGDPSAFTLYSLGTLYARGGEAGRAKSAFERVLEMKPDFAEASNGLGVLLAQHGNVPGAIELFRKALASAPDYPEAMNNLGYALLQTGHGEEAYELYQKALALQPDYPEAFNNLGIYFARQGDMTRAESYFKQAVDKRPEYGEAANNYALVLMSHDAVEPATTVLRRALQLNPEFEMSYVTLAKIYASTGRAQEAAQLLRELLRRNPGNPLAAQLLQQLGAS